uniref:Uncharacterized protein n=1 Tax=Anguilla anguilla TaxID=7936 RepID=A0A0E9S3D5_ANGAN
MKILGKIVGVFCYHDFITWYTPFLYLQKMLQSTKDLCRTNDFARTVLWAEKDEE